MLKPLALSRISTGWLAKQCKDTSLILAACLVFLVPFNAERNIDLQGLLLIVSGAFAWSALFIGHRQSFNILDRPSGKLLFVFIISCFISCLVNPHIGYSLFGAPYLRLGLGGFLACIGIGLLARTVPRQQLLASLYTLIIIISIIAIPYDWFYLHSLLRVSGVFKQADIFACFLGCGLVFGLEMFTFYPKHQRVIIICQAFLATMLILTQTRAVLFIAVVVWLLWVFRHRAGRSLKQPAMYVVVLLLLLVVLHYAVPGRLTNAGYASRSISYRLTLQEYALRASWQKPLWGYGPGNLADPLSCERLLAESLQTTCNEGYFFNSSHNIFIDRVLAVGWLGGLAFAGLVILAIYRGFRDERACGVLGYALLIISCYYLTNVTNIMLELLLWILLLRCLLGPIKVSRSHD